MLVIARASAQAGLESECYAQILDNAQGAPPGVQPLEIFAYSEPGDVGLLCGVTEPSRFDDFFLDRVRNAPATVSAWCYTLFDGQVSGEYFEMSTFRTIRPKCQPSASHPSFRRWCGPFSSEHESVAPIRSITWSR